MQVGYLTEGPRDNVETPGHTWSVARPTIVSFDRVVQRQALPPVSSSADQWWYAAAATLLVLDQP